MKKTVKNYLVFLLLITFSLLSSCSLRTCKDKDNVIGVYYNENELGTIHYLKLSSDDTFLHYYEMNNEKLSHTGKWEYNRKWCRIELDEWMSYGDKDTWCNPCEDMTLFVNGNYLDTGLDGEDKSSFKKKVVED